jgi:hypothetical protein
MNIEEWASRKNLLWINSMGRTGSSLCIRILDSLGFDCAYNNNMSEFHPVVKFNTNLLVELNCKEWAKRNFPSDYETRAFDDPVDDITVQQIVSLAGQLPEVVKEPRWSFLMPIWIRSLLDHQHLLPKFIFSLTRDPAQAAFSFIAQKRPHLREEQFPGGLQSAIRRIKIMERCAVWLEELGTKVFRLHYPEFLLEERPLFANAICSLNESLNRDHVLDQLRDMIDESAIHTYTIPGGINE